MPVLHHLALRTHDIDRLLAFYQRWFALPIAREARPRSVWLRLDGGAVLMLEQADAHEVPIAHGSRELVAFAVSPEERRHTREALVDAGLLEGETEHTLYFRDPDGRRVALSSYAL